MNNPLPLLQEKARAELNQLKKSEFIPIPFSTPETYHEGWRLAIEYISKRMDTQIAEIWNAAIQEAIGALPEQIVKLHGENRDKKLKKDDLVLNSHLSQGYNVALDDSRTRLEALLKV